MLGCPQARRRLGKVLPEEWRQIAPYFLGDFYPLAAYHQEDGVWMAWQFDRPDLGAGMVQVFRRTESPYESAHFPLDGLDPEACYTITGLDRPGTVEMAGRELLGPGLRVTLAERPPAAIFIYRLAGPTAVGGGLPNR